MNIFKMYRDRKKANRLEREEEDKLKKDAEIQKAEESRLDQKYKTALSNIILFAGNIKEYEKFRGYEPGSYSSLRDWFYRRRNYYQEV